MNTARLLLSALGAGLLIQPGAGDRLAFAPKPDSSVTKTIEFKSDFALDEISLIVNGQDVGAMIGSIAVSVKQENRIEVTDVYKSVAGGRPIDLLRTFDALSGNMVWDISPAQAEIPAMGSTSELEGATVAFHWNDDKQEYERSFHDGDGNAEILDGLREDMDLRAFLPESEVDVDSSWTVALPDLANIVMPGGNMRMKPEGMDMDDEGLKMFEGLADELGDEFVNLLEGECKCTFKGVHEEDGHKLGEIAIAIEVSTTVDLSRFLEKAIQAGIEQSGAGDQVQFSIDTADITLDFEGEGTLLWDLGASRAHSFHIGGDATIGLDLTLAIEAAGESQDVEASMELSGSMQQDFTTKE